MSIQDLKHYELISPDKLDEIRKLRKRRKFTFEGNAIFLTKRIGSGGIGVVFEATYNKKIVVVKFFRDDDSLTPKNVMYFGANSVVESICKLQHCPSMVRFIGSGVLKQEATGLERNALILEKGSENAQVFLEKTVAARKLTRLATFLVSLNERANASLGRLREEGLCHIDPDLSNFVLVQGVPKLSDFDSVASLDGEKFGLPKNTFGKRSYVPMELEPGEYTCAAGYDSFYYAYSLVLNLARAFKMSFKHFRQVGNERALNYTQRLNRFNNLTQKSINQVFTRLEALYSVKQENGKVMLSKEKMAELMSVVADLRKKLFADPAKRD